LYGMQKDSFQLNTCNHTAQIVPYVLIIKQKW